MGDGNAVVGLWRALATANSHLTACAAWAPAVFMVGEHVYGRLDVKDIRQILENAAAED